MPRTNLVNAVDDALAVAVVGVDTTITVVDASLLPPAPFYLVVDPFNDTQGREYMLCTLVTVNVLTVTRNLAGSDSDIHDVSDIVRITVAAQHIEDIWDSVEAIPPPVPQTFLHDDLTDVSASQHHTRYNDPEAVSAMGVVDNANTLNHLRYTDAEAVAAVGTIPPPQTFLHADLVDVSADQHHVKYTDAEAVAAVGPHTAPQTFLHADLTDVASLPSAHHTRYTDQEAVDAVGSDFLPLAGGSMLGAIIMPAGVPVQLGASAATGLFPDADTGFNLTLNGIVESYIKIYGTTGRVEVWSHDRVNGDGSGGGEMDIYHDSTLRFISNVSPGTYGVKFDSFIDTKNLNFFNDVDEQAGFLEVLTGAGRQGLLWVAGTARGTDDPWIGMWGLGDSGVDAGRLALRSNNDIWFSTGAGGSIFDRVTVRGLKDNGQTAPGAGVFTNISYSTAAPAGGIIGDVHLVI